MRVRHDPPRPAAEGRTSQRGTGAAPLQPQAQPRPVPQCRRPHAAQCSAAHAVSSRRAINNRLSVPSWARFSRARSLVNEKREFKGPEKGRVDAGGRWSETPVALRRDGWAVRRGTGNANSARSAAHCPGGMHDRLNSFTSSELRASLPPPALAISGPAQRCSSTAPIPSRRARSSRSCGRPPTAWWWTRTGVGSPSGPCTGGRRPSWCLCGWGGRQRTGRAARGWAESRSYLGSSEL